MSAAAGRESGPLTAADRGALALASMGGIGFLPGPCATYASLVLAVILWLWGAPLSLARLLAVAGLVLAASAGTVWAGGRAERRYGTDPHLVVLDEAAGMLLAALLVPWDAAHLGAAFLLFRVFDVIKPPPVYQLQALRAGWGILADDLAAGGEALLLLLAAMAWIPGF